MAIQIAIIYWGPAQRLLHTEALSASDLVLVLVVSTAVFWAVEFEKWVRRLTSARRVSQRT
jgi:Ca2+-transporting ATPase